MIEASGSSMRGRTVVITGANAGIGRATAFDLASRGARLVLACRSEERTLPVIAQLRQATGNDAIDYLHLDLSSLSSVRRCADEILARDLPLHVLVNNAGVSSLRSTTEDGFEIQFGVNHLGHFLLTKLLLDRLRRSAPARVVNVASKAHMLARGIDFDALTRPARSLTIFREYCVSKLANILHAAELARRLRGSGVTTYAVHPGAVASDIWRRLPGPVRSLIKLAMISNEEGAKPTLRCVTAPELAVESGLYYEKGKAVLPTRVARDPALAAELWRRSEEWTAPWMP